MSEPRPMNQSEYCSLRDFVSSLMQDGVESETIIDAIRDEIDERKNN